MLLKSMNLGVDCVASNFSSVIMYNYLPFLILSFLIFNTCSVEDGSCKVEGPVGKQTKQAVGKTKWQPNLYHIGSTRYFWKGE